MKKKESVIMGPPKKHTAHTTTHGAHRRHTATKIHTVVDTRRETKPWYFSRIELSQTINSSWLKIVILFESFSLTYICFLSFKRITHFSMMMNKFKIALINLQCRWEKWWNICICYEQETKNCRTASWLGNHVVSIKNISFGS